MIDLHSGYFKGNGKGAAEKFKGKSGRPIEEVKQFNSYGGIIDDGVVMIDIDDSAQSEVMLDIVEDQQLDCRVYQTTKGMHFMFLCDYTLKCKTGAKLACGLTADIKTSGNYHALKVDGVEREIIYDINEGEEYKTRLPKWLLPVNSKVDFFDMKEGDGRDSALYSYILTLTNAGFSKDESKECIGIINKYILKDSMTDADIERITRDGAFPEEIIFENGKFQHNKYGDYLINNYHFGKIDGRLYFYNSGVYVSARTSIDKMITSNIPTLKESQRNEVRKYIEIMSPDVAETSERYILFKNGVLDIHTNELLPLSPEYVISNLIPWNYNPNAFSEIADHTLNKISCFDNSIRSLLEECIGYCFYRKNNLQKAFILVGDGANGKSTYISIINEILGDGNVCSLDLKSLSDRFSKATLHKN